MHLLTVALAASLTTGLAATPALASNFQDLAGIDSAVVRFTGAQIGQAGGAQLPVDRQMRLAACQQPLALDWYGSTQTAVRVTCPGSWRIFVPLLQAPRAAVIEPQLPVVERNDLLRVEAGGAGFRVARQGEALEDGRVGESIRVKIDDGTYRGRIVNAQVVESGRVLIPIR